MSSTQTKGSGSSPGHSPGQSIGQHPLIQSAALLGTSGALFYFGAAEMAGRYGLSGLLAFIASTLVFIFSPLFLGPLQWLSGNQGFSSLADLVQYRFRRPKVGRATAIVTLLVCLPLGMAQLKAITGALTYFLPDTFIYSELVVGALICLPAILLAWLTCRDSESSDPTRNTKQAALPLVLAVGALTALAGLLAASIAVIFSYYGSYGALESWLAQTGQNQVIRRFDLGFALILLFFCATMVMPQFIYLDSWGQRNSYRAAYISWCYPLLLLLATLAMFPILWGGLALDLASPLQYYLVAIPNVLQLPVVSGLVMLGGLFVVVGTLATLSLAMADITKNYLTNQGNGNNKNTLRLKIVSGWLALCLLGMLLTQSDSITDLTIVGLVGLTQLMPGLLATFYLPKVNRRGFLAGLIAGTGLWFIGLFVPLFTGDINLPLPADLSLKFGLSNWPNWLLEATVANISLALVVSRFAKTSREEKSFARKCRVDLRQHHHQTLENLPIGVCSLDADGEILLWNNALTRYTGIGEQEAASSRLSDLPNPWGELLQGFIDADIPAQHGVEIKSTDIGKGSQSAWYNLQRSLPEAGAAHYGDQVILIEDITERLMLLRELSHNERLTSIGRLAAGVAHEIGNPVTGISCLAQELEALEDPAEVKDSARMILKQTGRISRIVNSLVNFSRGDEDIIEFSRIPLTHPVNDALQLLNLNKASTVVFHNRVPETLQLMADPHQLTQVFVNLFTNARNASPAQGDIVIDAEVIDNQVKVRVTDEGEGIPAELMDKVLEPFFTTRETGEGTGLGLSLVYSIVRHHGGTLDIQSPANHITGRGTCVILTFPTAS